MSTPMEIMLRQVDWAPTGNTDDDADGIPIATHSGILEVAGQKLRVYRLNTGEAIINADDLVEFFERGLMP